MANGSLMKVKSIAECILQYFWPALSYNQSWKQILVFFLSGSLRQVLLYITILLIKLILVHSTYYSWQFLSTSNLYKADQPKHVAINAINILIYCWENKDLIKSVGKKATLTVSLMMILRKSWNK